MTVALSLAYAAIVALLLNLGLASRWGAGREAGCRGGGPAASTSSPSRATSNSWAGPRPRPCRSSFACTGSPSKSRTRPAARRAGIFFWVSELDAAGLVASEPRAPPPAVGCGHRPSRRGRPCRAYRGRTLKRLPFPRRGHGGGGSQWRGQKAPPPRQTLPATTALCQVSSSAGCRPQPCRPSRRRVNPGGSAGRWRPRRLSGG